MNNLKEKIQDAQKVLLDAVLEFYKQNPDQCFTATYISNALGFYRGCKGKKNNWIAQGIVFELENKGHLKSCGDRNGHKYNK